LNISKAAFAAAAGALSLFFTSPAAAANEWKMAPLSSQVVLIPEAQELTENQRQEFLCMSLAIYHEARGVRDPDGQYAVAYVVLNRSESIRFPHTVCGVVWQQSQFTWTRWPVGAIVPREHNAWLASQQIAYAVLTNTEDRHDPTGGATHFFNVNLVRPAWARNPLHSWQNGAHMFVRLAGF